MFEHMLKLLHPFMPFLTEEVWHWTNERNGHADDLCVAAWPERAEYDKGILADIDTAKEVVTAIRNIRNDNGIPNKEKLELKVQTGDGYPAHLEPWIAHLTNLESPLNFARFYMGELLGPGVCKVLYLDADVIVQGDAAELADLALPRGAPI